MPVSVSFIRELEQVDPKLRHVLLSMIEELERQREESVTKVEFNELKEIVRDLGTSVKELAEAQKKTEAKVEELAEAQKRTEERLEELSQAQKLTEQRLASLSVKVEELAEAQKKTEEEIAKLAKRIDVVEDRLEGISNSVGYHLENSSYRALPKLLLERYGLKLEDRLIRRYLHVGEKEIQINIFGYAQKNGSRFLILGECKVRPSKKEIIRFEKYAKKIAEEKNIEPFLVFVAHDYPPKIEQFLQEKEIAYFWSYEFEN